MPKMGFWDRLLGVTQTIVPEEEIVGAVPGEEIVGAAAGAAAPKAAEAAAKAAAVAGEAPVELGAVLGQGPTLAQKAAQAAAEAAAKAAAPKAAQAAAAAAAELGWKEAWQKGTGALLKKIATVATTKRPTAAGAFGKGLGGLFLIILAQQLWSSLLQHGFLMPGGKGLEDLQKEAVGQQAQAALGMAKAQMPSESALLAQAMLGPMQQQAGQAQQAALQSGAQMSDMGWM
jgi:hypothetical protein